MAQLIAKWVISCENCSNKIRVDHTLLRPSPQDSSEHATVTGDNQIILFAEVRLSCGSGKNQSHVRVIRYFFDYPKVNKYVKKTARVINNTMVKHTYLLTTDQPLPCFQVVKEEAEVLRTIEHATVKNSQSI